MRRIWWFVWVLFSSAAFAQGDAEWAAAAKALGRAVKLQDCIYKVSFPRTDLKVRMGTTWLEPAAGLGSWMAFRKSENGVVTDGDLVLTADEVNPVVSALLDGGLEVTAIHNHLIGEEPQVMYVHFFGRGQLRSLSQALKEGLSKTKTPVGAVAAVNQNPPFAKQKEIEQTLGKSGTVNGKVLAFSFPRSKAITMHHQMLPPAMGMATAMNFQPSPKGVAATGDFVLLDHEVDATVKSLRKDGIMVTAMHNHLLDDEPRMVFVHFWAEGGAENVASGLRRALDAGGK